jgi:hypothetical protein
MQKPKRARCEAQARKTYGPKVNKKAKAKTHRSGG